MTFSMVDQFCRRLYRANGLFVIWDKVLEIGGFGVAHVWFQCYEKGYFEKCPEHYFRH